MLSLKKSRELRITLPVETGRLLCERAEERWHGRAGNEKGNRTVVQVWPLRSSRMGIGVVPIGSFTVDFGAPMPSQASITRLEWDPEHGGSEEAVRQAINSLVGWPIANESAHHRAPALAARA